MRINRMNYIQNIQGTDRANKNDADKSKGKASVNDNIEISETSREVRKQVENMKNNSSVNSKRVNEIKTAIENGTYSVSSKDIATKIMQKAREESLI